MKFFFITSSYEVYEINIFKFFFTFISVMLGLFWISTKLIVDESILNIIISLVISILISFSLTFFLTKKEFFSDKTFGDILSGIEGNQELKIQSYRNAIRERLGKNKILLPRTNKILLDELELIFRTHESCLPIDINNYSSINETISFFDRMLKNGGNVLEKFDIKLQSFYFIYHLNSIYYSNYYKNNEIVNTFLNSEIPEGLKLFFEFNTKPLYKIEDEYVKRFLEIRNYLKQEIINSPEKLLEPDLVMFDFSCQLNDLLEELCTNSLYSSLRGIICLNILSYSAVLKIGIEKKLKDQSPAKLSKEQVNFVYKMHSKMSRIEVNPTLELYRRQTLGYSITINEIFDFSEQFQKKYPHIVVQIINNFLVDYLVIGNIKDFKESYQKLSEFYPETIIIDNGVEIINSDFTIQRAIFKLFYLFHTGTLDFLELELIHTIFLNSYIDDSELQRLQVNIYRFAIILNHFHLVDWCKKNSLLSLGEMKSIEENLLGDFYYGNRLRNDAQLIYYCFPVAINKKDLGLYIS